MMVTLYRPLIGYLVPGLFAVGFLAGRRLAKTLGSDARIIFSTRTVDAE